VAKATYALEPIPSFKPWTICTSSAPADALLDSDSTTASKRVTPAPRLRSLSLFL
jgi:hypothetical protein